MITGAQLVAVTAGAANATFNIMRCALGAAPCTILSVTGTLTSGATNVVVTTPTTPTIVSTDAFMVNIGSVASSEPQNTTLILSYKCPTVNYP